MFLHLSRIPHSGLAEYVSVLILLLFTVTKANRNDGPNGVAIYDCGGKNAQNNYCCMKTVDVTVSILCLSVFLTCDS